MGLAREERKPGSASGSIRVLTAGLVVVFLLGVPLAAITIGSADVARIPVSGSPSTLEPAWEKPVNFVETGLPSGTSWSVNLSGTVQSSSTDTITFSEIPGTYPFSVVPVTGYVASPSSGNVTVTSCMGATVDISFTPIPVPTNYTVFFNETGLPTAAAWWVMFDGNNTSSSGVSITFSVPNGTYTFTADPVVAGAAGVEYVTNVTNGTVTVAGADVLVVIPYTTEYLLTMAALPPTGGNVTPGTGWYAAGSSVPLSATPASGYLFINWTGSGAGNYSGTNATPTIVMNGPIFENASFGRPYAVDFQETGLLDGVTWSVTFDGVTQSAYFVFLDFSAPNGTYSYSVAPIPGYHTSVYSGTVTVAGADQTIVVPWVRVTYNVTFLEAGLPTGTSWSVTLNGSLETSTTSSILFLEGNGSYPFTVSPVSGYVANVTSGSVAVNGTNVVVEIDWTPVGEAAASYSVTFIESGLPTGTAWSVTLNSTSSVTLGSTTTTVQFSGVPNGQYQYWVPGVAGYNPTPVGATFAVSGGNVTIDVAFALPPLSVHPTTTGVAVNVWDWLILAFIAGGGVISTYLIFRRR